MLKEILKKLESDLLKISDKISKGEGFTELKELVDTAVAEIQKDCDYVFATNRYTGMMTYQIVTIMEETGIKDAIKNYAKRTIYQMENSDMPEDLQKLLLDGITEANEYLKQGRFSKMQDMFELWKNELTFRIDKECIDKNWVQSMTNLYIGAIIWEIYIFAYVFERRSEI